MSPNVNKKKTYGLVEFLSGKKKECAVIPLIWLIDERKKCYWPKTKSQQVFDKLVFDNAPYDATWMKFKVHRVLKVSDDYNGIMKYMDIILEHGSTEDGRLNSIDISQKKIIEPSVNQEEENTSDSSDSSKRMITKTKYNSKKNMQKGFGHEESEFSHSNGSENEIKQRNFDDSREYDSSSSEKNVNKKSLKNNTSVLCTNKNIFEENKCRSQSSNVGRYNDGIASCFENLSSKNMQNVDVEYNRDTTVSPDINRCSSSRLEVGAGTTMSEQQFQKYIVERMENLTILCEQNNVCISRLLQTMQTFLNPTSKPDELPDLPLKNDNDFIKLEELLSAKTIDSKGLEVPAPAYTYLKGRLSTIGGADQRSSVMNMLKFVITNDLAMTYNWKGHNKKKSFENTRLREVITDAAKMQFKGSNSSDQYIKDAIQSWLKLAKSRYVYNTNPKKKD